MTSAINDNYPVQGNPTTASVRDNFTIAKNEITNLQSQVAALLASGVAPGGPAGGVLAGQYPNPGIAEPMTLTYPLTVGDAATEAVWLGTQGWVSVWGTEIGWDFQNTANPANQQRWQMTPPTAAGGPLRLEALTDDWTVQLGWTFGRDGTTTLPGPLVLPAAPVADNEAATKAYVDSLLVTIGALEARIARLEKQPIR